MWRDVYEHALDLFNQIFTSLEEQGTLNPDNEVFSSFHTALDLPSTNSAKPRLLPRCLELSWSEDCKESVTTATLEKIQRARTYGGSY